jgi:sugar-specific transcriptional regulator TrmB
MTAGDVAEALGISKSKAYQIIRTLNKELGKMDYITIAGKCPIKYFSEKYYGFERREGEYSCKT